MELDEILNRVNGLDLERIKNSKKNYVVFEELPNGEIELTFSNLVIVTTTLAKVPRCFHIFPNDIGMEDAVNSEIESRNVQTYFGYLSIMN
jgi:hypothetical protein